MDNSSFHLSHTLIKSFFTLAFVQRRRSINLCATQTPHPSRCFGVRPLYLVLLWSLVRCASVVMSIPPLLAQSSSHPSPLHPSIHFVNDNTLRNDIEIEWHLRDVSIAYKRLQRKRSYNKKSASSCRGVYASHSYEGNHEKATRSTGNMLQCSQSEARQLS